MSKQSDVKSLLLGLSESKQKEYAAIAERKEFEQRLKSCIVDSGLLELNPDLFNIDYGVLKRLTRTM